MWAPRGGGKYDPQGRFPSSYLNQSRGHGRGFKHVVNVVKWPQFGYVLAQKLLG